jgi:ornithine carbamoyltransferase
LILGCATLGIELSLGFPDNFPWVHDKLQHFIRTSREKNGDTVRIEIHHDAAEAVKGANAVYTDTWFDTGMVFKDGEKVELVNRMKPFQVNSELMKKASPGAYFLHCLPAERGNEVVDEVMDDAQVSLVWKQVENRLHVQKAILALLVT